MVIDTVVFDIGNVLLDWNPRYLYRKLFADEAAMEHFLSEVCSPAWNVAQDAGRSWREAEEEAIGRHPAQAELIRAYRARWHEMIPASIEGTVGILNDLERRGVPLYAITNFAADTFAESQERFEFLKRFRGVVVSGAERVLKPEARIYRLLSERYGLDLRRAVFIDDSATNVEGARGVGMAAIHFQSPEQLARELAAVGVRGA